MVDMIKKTISTYFVSNNGVWIDNGVKKPEWWGAIALRNASDLPEKTSLIIREFETGKILKTLPIVLDANAGVLLTNSKTKDDKNINLLGLENKRLSLELDPMGSPYIIMCSLNAKRDSALNPLSTTTIEVPLIKK